MTLAAPRRARPDLVPVAGGDGRGGEERATPCWFDDEGPRETPRYARDMLSTGARLEGPAIVEDAWSTTVLPPGATLEVDIHGHLRIDVGEAS